MAEITKGSVTSSFPDSLPDFTAQSEALDPASEDSTLAEGRDANKWSAEIEAIAASLGEGGRGEVTVSGAVATVESLDYVYQGTPKEYAGTASLSLQAGLTNYIYLNPSTNAASVSTSGWPSIPHLRLATWDGTSVLTDKRPHTLQIAAERPVLNTSGGQYLQAGTATVLNGNTSVAVNFGITFSSAPKIVLGGQRPNDTTLRKVGVSNKTTSGFTLHADTAAPAGGVAVDWLALGAYAPSVGSGSS